jgi:hypothetical protein
VKLSENPSGRVFKPHSEKNNKNEGFLSHGGSSSQSGFQSSNGPIHPMETRMILLAIDPYPHVVSPHQMVWDFFHPHLTTNPQV